MMTAIERVQLQNQALMGRRHQLEAVYSALLKLEMMGLTLENGMVECNPPEDINPLRWKAMLVFAVNNQGEIT